MNVAKKTKVTTKPSNPYKEGSRKAEIYDVFTEAGGGDAGLKAAYKRAAKVGIKDGTVKSWSSMWLKGETKPSSKAPDPDKVKATTPKRDVGFHSEFKHTSRAAADKAHEKLCTRAGLRAHAFHVIEDDGRFAVVPATYKPGGPVPTFSKGDTVYDALIANSKAKVIDAGPEQTMVRYVEERPNRPREECVINRFLVKLPDEEKPSNKKLQKAAEASGAFKGAMKPTTKQRQRL